MLLIYIVFNWTTSFSYEGLKGIYSGISVRFVTSINQEELDQKLSTCSACSHHLKLPNYSSENIFLKNIYYHF
jgi:hypothetical protein